MADNLTARANTGAGTDVLAADEIGSVFFPRMKLVLGADGVNDGDVAASNPLPVSLLSSTTVPDNNAQGANVRAIGQDIWSVSFTDSGASVLSNMFRAPDVGTGVTYDQTAGALRVITGTTANAEFLTRSLQSWRGAWALRFSTILSQRIANQNFAVLLADLVGENLACTINSATSITVTRVGHGFGAVNVGQFILVGGISGAAGVPGRYAIASVPTADTINLTVAGWPASGSCTVDLFGRSYVRHLYNGTVATNAAVDAQRNGWASGDTVATINTTAGVGQIMQTNNDSRTLTFADMLRASVAIPNVTTRASRVESIPDDNLDLYLFLWSYNGTVAPASTTTWSIGFASVEKFANTPVYVQGQRMQGTVAPAPVNVTNTVPVSGTLTATVASTTITSGTVSPLTVAGVSVEASSAKVGSGNSASAITNASGNGAMFFINVSAASGTGPTLVVRLQVQDPVSTNWVDVPGAATATITGTGLTLLTVHPSIVDVANSKVSMPLPRTYRFAWVIGGTTPSFTFSIGAQYII
jgi:hypothetical protein